MKLKIATVIACFIFLANFLQAQELDGFKMEAVSGVEATTVKSQGNTGTCWSFSCTSFLESEMIRQGKTPIDLSEMYAVRQTYLKKAERYLRFHGKANFSPGSLGHDVINVLGEHGAMPEVAFDGKLDPKRPHNHQALDKELKTHLDSLVKNRRNIDENWLEGIGVILDKHLGELPDEFEFEGKSYTAESFAKEVVGLNAEDYISFTSFSHHPFYKPFVLEVPDNFSHGLFYNLPINELTQLAEYALENGYSIEWDGDVSEDGFAARSGLAVVPEVDWSEIEDKTTVFNSPIDEKEITQQVRQQAFNTYKLTDDHLMHLTALVKDQTGKKYFLTKNSWGEIGPLKGYLYMSEAYFKLGTVSLLVHKDAIPADILEKLQ